MSAIIQASEETILIAALPAQYPYQFQQWPIARDHSSLHLRPGWHSLFARLCEDVHSVLTPVQRLSFSWLTVKERFGAMRTYFAGDLNPEVSQLVKEAEHQSTLVCEMCGQGATLRSYGGNWAARCSYHGVELAARVLLMRERHLSWAREAQISQQLAQWMQTPDPRWDNQSPRIYCATPLGTSILLELLMLQLEPVARLH